MRTQNKSMRHQQLVQMVSSAAAESRAQRTFKPAESFLDRPLPTIAWLVKDGVETLIDTRTHRKLRNGPQHRLPSRVLIS